MVINSVDIVHQSKLLTDKERAALITDDINNKKHLSEHAYEVLLSDIERRKREDSLGLNDTIQEVVEECIDHMELAVKGADSFLDKLGPIGFFISNGIGLMATPLRCFREKRWPREGEWIKLGLCVATIVFVAVSIAFPLIGGSFIIAATALGVVKSIQKIRIKNEELRHAMKQAHFGLKEITRLNEEIIKNEILPEKQEQVIADIAQLRTVTDQYVQYGYNIRRLREEIQHPVKSSLNHINVAMSAVVLIGLVVSIFFPPAGLGLLIGAGIVSLATFAVSAVSKWAVIQQKMRPTISSNEQHIFKETKINQASNQLNSNVERAQDTKINSIHAGPDEQPAVKNVHLGRKPLELKSLQEKPRIVHIDKEPLAVVPQHLNDTNAVPPMSAAQVEVGKSEEFQPLPSTDPTLIFREKEDSMLKSSLNVLLHTNKVEKIESKNEENQPEDEDRDEMR
jgi:hypothetical protein